MADILTLSTARRWWEPAGGQRSGRPVQALFVRLPWLEKIFMPTIPVVQPTSGAAAVSLAAPLRVEVRG